MKQKAITKVLKVCDKTKEQMIEFFEYSKREKTPPYAIFQAIDGDTIVTMYDSGKVVFQGKDADLASDYWIETEKINSGKNGLIEKKEKSRNCNIKEKYGCKMWKRVRKNKNYTQILHNM